VPQSEPEGLGGWLIAWAAWLGLCVLVLALFGVIVVARIVEAIGSGDVGEIGLIPFALLILLFALVALGVVVLMLFFRRSRRTRLACCCWLTAVALPLLALEILTARINVVTLLIAIPLLICVSGLVYFARSRRVLNTFRG
jgi:hypothetical protein